MRLSGSIRALAVAAHATLGALSVAPADARAYEHELSLGIETGIAHALGPELPGVRAGIHASYGIDDTWAIAAQLGYSIHPDASPLHVAEAAAELLYVIDVVRVVPYVGVGASYFGTLVDQQVGGEGGAHVVGGAHYYLSRAWAVGLDVRGHALFTALEEFPIYVTATLRLSWIQVL
ncbi:MAG: outer membrane beta-barrel protein [Deltaproteobacteria bacterium]|nr:outer membrane beta-barrel protein [Deltaproteobacteria bacterium]